MAGYHCVESVRIRSYSGPHFPAFGMNTERNGVSLRIQSECGKMMTRITPNTDTFHAVYNYEFWHYKAIPIYTSSVSLVKVSSYFWNRAKVWNLWMKAIQVNVHLNACLLIFLIDESLLTFFIIHCLPYIWKWYLKCQSSDKY